MNLNQHQQIEKYLSGQMSPEEASLFESQLDVNPELRQEMNFQSDVIQGISEYRKLQLKARLDSINVTSSWWTSLQYSSVAQYIGSAVLVAMIGGGIYWWADKWSVEEVDNIPVEVKIPVVEKDNQPELAVTPDNKKETTDEKSNDSIAVTEGSDKISSVENEVKAESPAESEKPVVKQFKPKVQVPSAGNVNEEKSFSPDELPTPAESTASAEKNTPVDVEVVDSKSSRIKYRYYAGKLFLYGNFTNEPYEILEINSSNGRSIYLYHMNAYYEILPSDKPVGVREIVDEKLIQELSILRKAK